MNDTAELSWVQVGDVKATLDWLVFNIFSVAVAVVQ